MEDFGWNYDPYGQDLVDLFTSQPQTFDPTGLGMDFSYSGMPPFDVGEYYPSEGGFDMTPLQSIQSGMSSGPASPRVFEPTAQTAQIQRPPMSLWEKLALGATLGTAGLGIGGALSGLFGGGGKSTKQTSTISNPPSAQENKTFDLVNQLLGGRGPAGVNRGVDFTVAGRDSTESLSGPGTAGLGVADIARSLGIGPESINPDMVRQWQSEGRLGGGGGAGFGGGDVGFGGGGGLMGRISGRSPFEDLAYAQGIGGLSELQASAMPASLPLMGLGGAVPGLAASQAGLLGQAGGNVPQMNPAFQAALAQQAARAAGGGLPSLDPATEALVNAMFSGPQAELEGAMANIVQNAVEQGRRRGFTYDLQEGPVRQMVSQEMPGIARAQALLESQKAAQKLSLAQSLPMLGGQLEAARMNPLATSAGTLGSLSGMYNQPLALRFAGMESAGRLGGGTSEALTRLGQQGIMSQVDLVNALAGLGRSQQRPGGTTQTTLDQPFSLMDAFDPLSKILGGVGGVLGGLGSMNRPQYNIQWGG